MPVPGVVSSTLATQAAVNTDSMLAAALALTQAINDELQVVPMLLLRRTLSSGSRLGEKTMWCS